jgi:capsule polysaccharide export protein KpsE/RkpR
MANMASAIDLSFLRSRAVLKRIAIVTIAFAVVGLLYGLLAPKWYRSVLTVVPAKSQRGGGGLASLLGSDAGALAAGFLEGSAIGGADAARVAAVLQSIAVSDAVIEKFDLGKRYGERYRESTREALWRHCDVKVLTKPGLVQLSCEDKDPKFVQEMLAYFAGHGNEVFRRVGVSSASEEARFLEKRVAELRQQADDAAARMRDFQEKYKIVDLDTQAKAVVSALAALNSQRISKQLELDYARTFSAREEPTLRQLESQLSVMGQKVKSLEEPAAADPPAEKGGGVPRPAGAKGGMFPAALEVPKLRAEFETLYRDRKVAEATLVFALERLEGARANEAREVSTFLILDPPALPTRHSRPKRTMTLALWAMLGFAASLGFELVRQPGAIASLIPGGSSSRPLSRTAVRVQPPVEETDSKAR